MAGNMSGPGMLGGISFQMGNCQVCGAPIYPNQLGHTCQPPDPRIMAELRGINEKLAELLNAQAFSEALK